MSSSLSTLSGWSTFASRSSAYSGQTSHSRLTFSWTRVGGSRRRRSKRASNVATAVSVAHCCLWTTYGLRRPCCTYSVTLCLLITTECSVLAGHERMHDDRGPPVETHVISVDRPEVSRPSFFFGFVRLQRLYTTADPEGKRQHVALAPLERLAGPCRPHDALPPPRSALHDPIGSHRPGIPERSCLPTRQPDRAQGIDVVLVALVRTERERPDAQCAVWSALTRRDRTDRGLVVSGPAFDKARHGRW